jgi:hypothetical protein
MDRRHTNLATSAAQALSHYARAVWRRPRTRVNWLLSGRVLGSIPFDQYPDGRSDKRR